MEKLQELLGDLSPLDSKGASARTEENSLLHAGKSRHAASGMSVSFGTHAGSKADSGAQPAKSSASSMSTSDVPPRQPLGDVSKSTSNVSFDFRPQASQPMPPPISRLAGSTPADSGMLTPLNQATTPLDLTPPRSVVGESSGAEAVTPAPGAAAASAKPQLSWADVLLWKESFRSMLYFLSGLALLGAATWVMFGNHGISLVSGLAYAALADLGFNFLRFFVSSRWQHASLWVNSKWTIWLQARATTAIGTFAKLHDAYLSSMDPFVTLRVAAGLWALAWLGTVLHVWTVVLIGYVAAFTLPAVYLRNKASFDGLVGKVYAKTWAPIEALEMPRTSRLFVTALALAGLFFVGTWVQFAIGCFVAATYWRTTLAPQQVEEIREAVAPYTHSVRKTAKRLSMVLDDAMVRYSTGPATRTKSHFA